MLLALRKIASKILLVAGLVSTIKDIPWYWALANACLAGMVTIISSTSDRIAQLSALQRWAFYVIAFILVFAVLTALVKILPIAVDLIRRERSTSPGPTYNIENVYVDRRQNEQRDEAISQLLGLLAESERAFQLLPHLLSNYQENRGKEAQESYDTLDRYYHSNIFWLDSQSRQNIENYLSIAGDVLVDFYQLTEPNEACRAINLPDTERERDEMRASVARRVYADLPNLNKEIGADFRTRLQGSEQEREIGAQAPRTLNDESLRQRCCELSTKLYEFYRQEQEGLNKRLRWTALAELSDISQIRREATTKHNSRTMDRYGEELGSKVLRLSDDLAQYQCITPETQKRFETPKTPQDIQYIAQRLKVICSKSYPSIEMRRTAAAKRKAVKDLLGKAMEEGQGLRSSHKQERREKYDAVRDWVRRTHDLIEAAFDKTEAQYFRGGEIDRGLDPVDGCLSRLEQLIARVNSLDINPDFDPQDQKGGGL